jgi:3-methylcrotonyl-CoA carboxylase alpha subunit
MTLASARFGGDAYERHISLQLEKGTTEPASITIKSLPAGFFDITVRSSTGTREFKNVKASLSSATKLSLTLDSKLYSDITVFSQRPPPTISQTSTEKIHLFDQGKKITFLVPPPKWLSIIQSSILNSASAKGAIKAPMPSLVVEVKVKVGDMVKRGEAVVVLESMKTETVLRADVDGKVTAVGCGKGEMVAEGRELATIEVEGQEAT